MTFKQRRRRGLCIDCEAPAAGNRTLPSARALAISEGRGLTSDARLRGMPVERLTTNRRCDKCMEKRNKCSKCGKQWKEAEAPAVPTVHGQSCKALRFLARTYG